MTKTNFMPLNIQLFAEDGNTAENTAENTASDAEKTADNTAESAKEETKKETKTFTQEELNTIVQDRLSKAKKGIPSQEELKAFNDWKESQKSAEEKQAEKEKENQKVLSERDSLQKENLVLRKGVNDDDVDYVIFKVSKMEGEFKDNLTQYLTDNPKFIKGYQEPTKKVDLSGNHNQEKSDDLSHERKLLGI